MTISVSANQGVYSIIISVLSFMYLTEYSVCCEILIYFMGSSLLDIYLDTYLCNYAIAIWIMPFMESQTFGPNLFK